MLNQIMQQPKDIVRSLAKTQMPSFQQPKDMVRRLVGGVKSVYNQMPISSAIEGDWQGYQQKLGQAFNSQFKDPMNAAMNFTPMGIAGTVAEKGATKLAPELNDARNFLIKAFQRIKPKDPIAGQEEITRAISKLQSIKTTAKDVQNAFGVFGRYADKGLKKELDVFNQSQIPLTGKDIGFKQEPLAPKEIVRNLVNNRFTKGEKGLFSGSKPLPKEVGGLVEEARKYKSAEEFVKAQGKEIYHSTDSETFNVFDPSKAAKGETYFNPLGDGLFLSKDREFTRRFGKNTFEYILPKDAKTKIITDQKFQLSEYPAAVKGTLKKLGIKYDDLDLNDKVMINRLVENNPPIQALNEVEFLIKEDIAPKFGVKPKPNQVKDIMQGIMTDRNSSYDAVIYRSTDDLYGTADKIIVPKDKVPNLKTKSQLTKLWEEANKSSPLEPLAKEVTPQQLKEFLNNKYGNMGGKIASSKATGQIKRAYGDYLYSQDREAFNALLEDIRNGRNLNDADVKEFLDKLKGIKK